MDKEYAIQKGLFQSGRKVNSVNPRKWMTLNGISYQGL